MKQTASKATALHRPIFRGFVMAGVIVASLASSACTPLRVVTHTVSTTEASVPAGRYMLDAQHWSITFDVEHLKYSRFTMRFDRAQAELAWQPGGLAASTVEANIDAASVDTNVPILNKMVAGPQMLDAATYPALRFVGTRFVKSGDASGTLEGALTIRGVTRPVRLNVTFNGYGRDPLTKADKLGFSADGRFSRSLFGLTTWYPAVGDDVHVHIEAEFDRRQGGDAG